MNDDKYNEELYKIRNEIDELDTLLISLLEKRMGISVQVAAVKKKHNMKIFDASRENAIIDSLSLKLENKNLDKYIKNIFAEIFSNSRALQQENIIKDKLNIYSTDISIENKNDGHIAYQGIKGGYGYEASCKMFDESSNLISKKYFDDVLSSVYEGEVAFGVLPVENTFTGTINDVLDILVKYNASIVAELYLDINHALLGTKSSSIETIKKVVSHNQALKQCSNYIRKYNFYEEATSNTAYAALKISEENDDTIAAIGSKHNASIYGLKILDENIENMKGNQTRFIVVKNALNIEKSKGNKITIRFTLPHEKYSLVRALNNFDNSGINMSSIISRPNRDNAWQYYFYVDMIADWDDRSVIKSFNNFKSQIDNFNILGRYQQA